MSKKLIVTVMIFVIVIISGLAAFALGKDSTQSSSDHHEVAGDHHSDGHNEHDEKADVGKALDETNQSEVAVDIVEFAYAKPNLKISKGTTVTWTNRETVKHNVMGVHSGETRAHDAPTADQVEPDVFAGPLLAKGESYSFTFDETGAFDYHCAPHPYMKASIVVVE